ncbi:MULTISPECIES: hypothetical protein [Rhodococcus]|uniref:Acyltransferase n=1 Tax=Rhodococcus cerastii TaxID=908616 RepID=A0ABU4CXW3_9NOCA|nr:MULTISPECIES: hypothetical protein [Rhodococcus]MDI9925580.1 hypothetical protein [Rhodococcus sp. IEGM 1341]MDV6302275.1 hypothetical protein [Rhodococcus cerastii]MDV8058161.1 hypothetical protein [Rhodococcus sp. IEGM 1343]
MLVWLSSIPFPAMLSRVAGVLASASLYIYLIHFQVYLPLRDDHPWLAFALSILYWKAVEFVLSLRSRIMPRSRAVRSDIVAPSDLSDSRPREDNLPPWH